MSGHPGMSVPAGDRVGIPDGARPGEPPGARAGAGTAVLHFMDHPVAAHLAAALLPLDADRLPAAIPAAIGAQGQAFEMKMKFEGTPVCQSSSRNCG